VSKERPADALAQARYWDIREAHDSLAGRPGHEDIEPGQILNDDAVWLAAQQPFLALAVGEAYPTPWAKAASALRIICQRHPFTQGNKRTAWLYAVIVLGQRGIKMPAAVDEAAMLGMMSAVAVGRCDDVEMIAQILQRDVYEGRLYG
jgi:prophage maintenance system killer protein